jgi:hypothetical protein
LVSGNVYNDGNLRPDTEKKITVLKETPGRFLIAYPHQYDQFVSQSPFFYEDDQRTFLVLPRTLYNLNTINRDNFFLQRQERARPESIDVFNLSYYSTASNPSILDIECRRFRHLRGYLKSPVTAHTGVPGFFPSSPTIRYQRTFIILIPAVSPAPAAPRPRRVVGSARIGEDRRQQLSGAFFMKLTSCARGR